MKNSFKILSLLSLLILASASFFIFAKRPADEKPETIVVKAVQGDLLDKSVVEVIYGGDKTEVSKFGIKENLDLGILNIIQKLNADGYKVISQSSYVKISGGGNVGISSREYEYWVLGK